MRGKGGLESLLCFDQPLHRFIGRFRRAATSLGRRTDPIEQVSRLVTVVEAAWQSGHLPSNQHVTSIIIHPSALTPFISSPFLKPRLSITIPLSNLKVDGDAPPVIWSGPREPTMLCNKQKPKSTDLIDSSTRLRDCAGMRFWVWEDDEG